MKNIYAILIGVDNYQSNDITNLPFCKEDLRLMKKCMLQNLKLKDENMTVLGENGDVKRTDILRTLNFVQNISQDIDTLIFYFTGHGTSKKKEGYLVTSDTEIDLPSETSISISSIVEKFKNSTIKNKLLIVDSCYSGIDFSKGNQNLFEDFDADLDLMISEGWTLAASCKGDEVSYLFPEKDVSVFTYYLVEAFNILPETLNLNELSIDQIYDYTSKKVAKWAFENHKSQTPTLKSERVGTLKFKVNLDTDYTIDTTLASVGDKVIIESTKIILNTSKYFPASITYKDYGFNILGSSYPIIRPNMSGLIGQEEIKTINYTNDERIEKRENFEEKAISTFLGRCLDYVKPSQILRIDSHNYELPFGNLQIANENDYQSSITLEIQKKDLNKEINIFLQELDDQQIVEWKRLSYSFDGTFNFDLLTDKLKKEGYKISNFDLYNNKIIANFGEEKDILTIGFTNLEGESFIEIQTRNDLPKDFFDVLPTQKIFEDFQDTISDNC